MVGFLILMKIFDEHVERVVPSNARGTPKAKVEMRVCMVKKEEEKKNQVNCSIPSDRDP